MIHWDYLWTFLLGRLIEFAVGAFMAALIIGVYLLALWWVSRPHKSKRTSNNSSDGPE